MAGYFSQSRWLMLSFLRFLATGVTSAGLSMTGLNNEDASTRLHQISQEG